MDFQLISTQELQLLLDNSSTSIIDTRPVEAYNGWQLNKQVRGGHIRGARCVPLKWANYIDWIEIVRSKGILPEQTVIVYSYEIEDAEKAGKLAAFTETGLESIPDTTWWTRSLLPAMQMYDAKLAYVLVWRNDSRSPTHYYAPFPGHPSVPDFMEFFRNPYTLFENDLDGIYND